MSRKGVKSRVTSYRSGRHGLNGKRVSSLEDWKARFGSILEVGVVLKRGERIEGTIAA